MFLISLGKDGTDKQVNKAEKVMKMDPDSALYKTLTKVEASWLEGLEEDDLVRQFEESIRDDPKDIQDLKRKMRNMQGDWEKRLKKECAARRTWLVKRLESVSFSARHTSCSLCS